VGKRSERGFHGEFKERIGPCITSIARFQRIAKCQGRRAAFVSVRAVLVEFTASFNGIIRAMCCQQYLGSVQSLVLKECNGYQSLLVRLKTDGSTMLQRTCSIILFMASTYSTQNTVLFMYRSNSQASRVPLLAIFTPGHTATGLLQMLECKNPVCKLPLTENKLLAAG
jgi:hypothetical protein